MIDNAHKEEFRKVYSAYASNKDDVADRNASINDLIKTFAKKVEIKPAIISKVLANLYKKEHTGTDEVGDVAQVLLELEQPN